MFIILPEPCKNNDVCAHTPEKRVLCNLTSSISESDEDLSGMFYFVIKIDIGRTRLISLWN